MTLDQYLSKNGISSAAFARSLGVNSSVVWRVRYNKVRPDWDTVEAITLATSGAVTANDFLRKWPLKNPVSEKKQG